METLIIPTSSSSHPLLLQSSKNRAFSSLRSSLHLSVKKVEFLCFQHKSDYNVDVFPSNSLDYKAVIGSVSCKSSSSESSFVPESQDDKKGEWVGLKKSVRVRLEWEVDQYFLGEQILVIGLSEEDQYFNGSRGLPMEWSHGNIWTLEIDVSSNPLGYMFIHKHANGQVITHTLPRLVFLWDTNNTIVVSGNGHPTYEESPSLKCSNNVKRTVAESKSKANDIEVASEDNNQHKAITENDKKEEWVGLKKSVRVRLEWKVDQYFLGEQILVIGLSEEDQYFNGSRGLPMEWSHGNIWTLEIDVSSNPLGYMFIHKHANGQVIRQTCPSLAFLWDTNNTIVVNRLGMFEESSD